MIDPSNERNYDEESKKWLQRELQLTRLHEEIVLRRQALLHSSQALQRSQNLRSQSNVCSRASAEVRNEDILQRILDFQSATKERVESISPRFETLKANYWAMVRGMLPIWEESVNKMSKSQQYPQDIMQ